jgi:hypothetical protein
MWKIFNVKTILLLIIIVGAGYLSSKFPDEAVLIWGCLSIIVIGIWMLQANKEQRV